MKKPSEVLEEMRINTLGGRIEAILKELEFSQSKLARMLKVRPQAVSGWIYNRSVPNFENLGKIAMLLPNLNLKWFFTGEGPMTGVEMSEDPQKVIELQERIINLQEKLINTNNANKNNH
jgi:transcriptional regulator with XRE-family HTH domain